MKCFPREQLAKIARIVGYERKAVGNNLGHKIPIGRATEAQPIDMIGFVTLVCRG